MAAIALNISSNSLGILTSSYILHDAHLDRILEILRRRYQIKDHFDVSQEDQETQVEHKQHTTQQLLDLMTKFIFDGIIQQVRETEIKDQYEQIVNNWQPITLTKAK